MENPDPGLGPAIAGLARQVQSVAVIQADRPAPCRPRRDEGRHTVPTLLACLQGTVRLELADGDLDLRAGMVAVIAPWVLHAHPPTRAGCAALLLGIRARHCDLLLQGPGCTAGDATSLRLPREPAASQLAALLACPDPNLRLRQARHLFAGLAQQAPQAGDLPRPVRLMSDYLLTRLGATCTATAVLAASGLGRRRAHALFTTHFGATPKAHLDRLRLEWAQRLLRTGMPVAEVARTCGFRRRSDLTRRCRLLLGTTPSRFQPRRAMGS
jgi:AraC-like DNA-binding protein